MKLKNDSATAKKLAIVGSSIFLAIALAIGKLIRKA